MTPERLKARQLAKARAFELEQSKKKVEVLKPKVVGCCWDKPGKTLNFMEEVLLQYKVCANLLVLEGRLEREDGGYDARLVMNYASWFSTVLQSKTFVMWQCTRYRIHFRWCCCTLLVVCLYPW